MSLKDVSKLILEEKYEESLRILDSLLNQNPPFDELFQIQTLNAEIYFHQGNFNRTIKVLDEIKLSLEDLDQNLSSTKTYLAEFHSNYADTLFQIGKIHNSIEHRTLSADFNIQISHWEKAGRQFNAIGNSYSLLGDIIKAKQSYDKALEMAEKGTFILLKIKILSNLGFEISLKEGNIQKAIDYLKKSESLAIDNDQIYQLIVIYTGLISIYCKEGNLAKAKEYLDLLQVSSERISIPNLKSHSTDLVEYANAMYQYSQPRLGDQFKALPLFEKLIDRGTLQFDLLVQSVLHVLNLLFIEYEVNKLNGVFDQILKYVDYIRQLAHKENSILYQIMAYRLETKLYFVQLNMKKAFELLDKAAMLAKEAKLTLLQQEISIEQDELKTNIEDIEKMSKDSSAMIERLKWLKIDDYIKRASTLTKSIDV